MRIQGDFWDMVGIVGNGIYSGTNRNRYIAHKHYVVIK